MQINWLNGWRLFFLIAAFNAAIMAAGFATIGVATPQANVDIIRLAVQAAAPWIIITFAARPLAHLRPNGQTAWLARNRRYLGLSFAAGMGWQLVFIAVLFGLHAAYYWNELHSTPVLIFRIASYGVLLALTVTSFYPIRRLMRPTHWRWLHLFGAWYLFAAIWISYVGIWVEGPVTPSALIFSLAGFAALGVRGLLAWRTISRTRGA